MILDRARCSKTPRPLSQASSVSNSNGHGNVFDTVTTAHYSIGYEGDKAGSGGRVLKGGTMKDSRQRIADAMGRR